ncbi:hypothetical protein SLA2020_473680 [Shorea laevis]
MPSSCRLIIGLSIARIKKFIPNRWRKGAKAEDIQSNQPFKLQNSEKAVLEPSIITNDESMIKNLLASLQEYATQGQLLPAFKVFSLIKLHTSYSASDNLILRPISSLLLSCTNLKLLPAGKQLHAQIMFLGLEQSPILVHKLVSFYSTFDLLDDARLVIENSNILHPLSWNLLISSYVRNGLFEESLCAYKHMVSKGIRPDNFTYPSVLKACGETLDLELGKTVYKSINDSCQEWCLYVHNALISMYGKFGELDVARCLFEKMPERDTVSWNTIISCFASRSLWEDAFEFFEKMQVEDFELSIITCNIIAGMCLRTGNFSGALQLLSQMRTSGAGLDSVTIITGLGACSHVGTIKLGKEIHGFVIRNCYDGFDSVRNALITMYSSCKDLWHAYTLFQSIEEKSIITWNSMLSGYAHVDRPEEASFLFREMLLSGVEPNYVTIASILPLFARVANLQHGKEFHCYLARRAVFKDYLLLWNALVDMYARSGKILAAKRVFDLMKRRDGVTYTSLIAGYGMQGKGETALKLFKEMIELQIKPDDITMVAVLSACGHSGLVAEGQMWFQKMQSIHGIIPTLEHFACMVDLYGRAGMLNKAMETISRMPYKPSPATWAALIGACRIHGNTDIGEWAAEKLLELRPENSGYYVLIGNMYAAAGRWDKLAKVRTFMQDLGLRKAPSCSPRLIWAQNFQPLNVGK